MTTIGFILILVLVLLGGSLAAIGDRVGSRIGKKRMRLFNLRPKQTATLMTILTGTLISASTLILLFASSKPLRQGVFELDRLLEERRAQIKDLESKVTEATEQKNKIESELKKVREEQVTARQRLDRLNRNYQSSRKQLRAVSERVARFQEEARRLQNERNVLNDQKERLIAQRDRLERQKTLLAGQIGQLQTRVQDQNRQLLARERQLESQRKLLENQQKLLTERQTRLQRLEIARQSLQGEIDRRDARISELDRSIVGKNLALEQTEGRLRELESQIVSLRREVEVLEQYYQTYQELREKQIAIVRGQVLSFGAFRVVDPGAIVGAIDQLLRQANTFAIRATRPRDPNPEERVVKITKAQVEQLIQQLQDGGEYVVRILSAGNYVIGEREVRVVADVVPNRQIFSDNQVIAAVSVDSRDMSEEELQNRLDLLLASAQFRARSAGVLGTIQVEDGLLTTVVNFIDRVKRSEVEIDTIEAIASEETKTAGPLKLRLVAKSNGEMVFTTTP
ncbi:DUF3084 domain-containing protein [Pannus brasiliensis CCIBt3594]|uniref:DUF3084 domain-containing protein n=1 Tax=Pannus brasiliensis CCIBt3594 TaxID=1427578 RepID=A0AAW9QSJ2_9CHRO